MKVRIWELDAVRGVLLLFMVFIHLMVDLTYLYGILDWQFPLWFDVLIELDGIGFVLLSGLCATLGRHSVRRGLLVLACGLTVTAATYCMYLFGFDKSILIYFGVLHCLGVCMLLWPLLLRLPTWVLVALGVAMVSVGYLVIPHIFLEQLWLLPLGIHPYVFATSDYFPLLPNLGYFLVGAALGRCLYRKKVTLFPRVNPQNPIIRALCFCGRQSLVIYMVHQPILSGLCMLLL